MRTIASGECSPVLLYAAVILAASSLLVSCADVGTGVDPADTAADRAEPDVSVATSGGDAGATAPDVCAGVDCLECAAGEAVCDGACVDVSDDPSNCGACGFTCGFGEACEAGACVTQCTVGTVACDGACVDLARSDAHCGACGTSCGSAETCFEGTCTASCAANETRCGATCVSLANSVGNCGACGVVCGDGSTCSNGACACHGGFGDCDGQSTNGCETDLLASATHCGACGVSCFCGEGGPSLARHTPHAGDPSATPGAIDVGLSCGVAPTTWAEPGAIDVRGDVTGRLPGRVVATTPTRAQWLPDGEFRSGERVRVRVAALDGLDSTVGTAYGWEFHVAAVGGTGNFEAVAYPSELGQTAVTVADIDGDRWFDMVTCGRDGAITVWRGSADGFVPDVVGNASGTCVDVDAADVDGDGDADLVVGGSEGIWFNEDDGFERGAGVIGTGYTSVVVDVDGDSDVDIVRFGAETLPTVYYNEGAGNFGASSTFGVVASWFDAAPADVDGDGDLDIVVSTWDEEATYVWVNDGGRFVDSGQRLAPVVSYGLDVADFDGDGDSDVFVSDYAAGAQVWLNDGTGRYVHAQTLHGRPGTVAVRAGDFDADGDLDVYTTHWEGMSEQVWENFGNAMFTGEAGVDVGSSGMGAAVVDVDGDGAVDVVVVGDDPAAPVRVWYNGE